MQTPRKASTAITLVALGALSLAMVTACSDDDGPTVAADCVIREADGKLKAVDDKYCSNSGGGGGHSTSSFVWIYGGSYSNGHVYGGSYTKPPNTNIASRSGRTVLSNAGKGTVSRGGFGSRGSVSGSGS
ncbi:hypothetical protein DQ384_26210 [Sphaerisporangium album]|uniref:Lipoprotein n=1 Tax=Sphaerisporangium album TaxID=509200 RepID=A0A367FA03_9ACTN|nr:hypothetical protein [Sphaerisporangium album]RCG27216.1 hypothetical protein DQ384_26210 [Sphaerisporangium album]